MRRFLFIAVIVFISCIQSVAAQCSMCRAVLETGANAKTAEQLNDGIVYLMVIPYLLVAVVGYIVYTKVYKK